jgi:hypothetical protein
MSPLAQSSVLPLYVVVTMSPTISPQLSVPYMPSVLGVQPLSLWLPSLSNWSHFLGYPGHGHSLSQWMVLQ